MARTRSQRMADRMLNGQLEETLHRLRRSQISWAGISRILLDDYGIEVSAQTLREQWAKDFGLESHEAEPKGAA